MIDWPKLVASGDIVSIILFLMVALISGGVINSLIESHRAKKRGVSGDALQREVNNTTEFDALSGAQKDFITELRQELASVKQELKDYKTETDATLKGLKADLEDERQYNADLIEALIDASINPPSRRTKHS